MFFEVFKKYPNLLVAFSQKIDGSMKFTKNGEHLGNSTENIKNRQKFLESLGVQNLFYGKLIHGNNIEIIRSGMKPGFIDNCDGLITEEKNTFLSVTAADCLPIFLLEPAKEIVGIVHAGWRSLEKNVLSNAIGKIKSLGGSPEDILVGIGPAICQKHYEVGPEVAEKFEKYPEAVKEVRPRRIHLWRKSDKVLLDIKRIARLQLTTLGLSEKNIDISSDCTFELPQKYFSARRDKKKEVEAMMAVIGIRK